jgi:hypothetical protein
MPSKLLFAEPCSQMDDPINGTGSGGDRCTYAVFAAMDKTSGAGPQARAGASCQQIMYERVFQDWKGRVAKPMNAVWVGNALKSISGGKVWMTNKTSPCFVDIVAAIDRNHICMAGFNDYNKLKLADGKSPYSWRDPNGLGHVVVVVGYDSDKQTVWVQDPLLAEKRMPCEYSWASFQAAQFSDLSELEGFQCKVVQQATKAPTPQPAPQPQGGVMPVPTGWKDDPKAGVLTASNGIQAQGGFRQHIINSQSWAADNVPLEAEHAQWPLVEYDPKLGNGNEQIFSRSLLAWNQTAGVRELEVGRELLKARQDIAALKSQIQTASAQLEAIKNSPPPQAQMPAEVHQALVAMINALGPLASVYVLAQGALKVLDH